MSRVQARPPRRDCTLCGRKHRSRFQRCTDCRRRVIRGRAKWRREYRQELLSNGLCPRCKDPLAEGRKLCTSCLKEEVDGITARRAAKRAELEASGKIDRYCLRCLRRKFGTRWKTCRRCLTRIRQWRMRDEESICGCGQLADRAPCHARYAPKCSRCRSISMKPQKLPHTIAAIERHPDSSVYELAEESGVSTRGVLRHVKILIAKGMVVKRSDDSGITRYRCVSGSRR